MGDIIVYSPLQYNREKKIDMNSPVLPPQKLIVPREFSLLIGFNLFAVLWVHIAVVHSYTTKLINIDSIAFLSVENVMSLRQRKHFKHFKHFHFYKMLRLAKT